MVDWYLNAFLFSWRAFVNLMFPNRPKGSDGTIGDEAHQASNSQHNPDSDGSVDAWDMTAMSMEVFFYLLNIFKRAPGARLVIANRKLYHKNNGWLPVPYNGVNPHTGHWHWEADQASETSQPNWQQIAATTGGAMGVAYSQWDRDRVSNASDKASAIAATVTNNATKLAELDAQDDARHTVVEEINTDVNALVETVGTLVTLVTNLPTGGVTPEAHAAAMLDVEYEKAKALLLSGGYGVTDPSEE